MVSSFSLIRGFYIFLASIALLGILSSCGVDRSLESNNEVLRIHDVQGCAHISPYRGRYVEGISGIVTKKVRNGFYLQDDRPDDKFCSSEGIFIFTQSYPSVKPGEKLLVAGVVDEFQPGEKEDANLTLTQLINPHFEVISRDNTLPTPILIGEGGYLNPDKVVENDEFQTFQPDEDGIDFYESLESMLVRVDSGSVVGAKNSFNEVVIIPTQLTTQNVISGEGALLQQPNDDNPERIILNLNDENRDQVRVGAYLQQNIAGIMTYAYGNYKIDVFGVAQFSNPEVINTKTGRAVGTLRIVSYNVTNLSRYDKARLAKIENQIIKDLELPDIVILHEVLDDSGVEDDGVVSSSITLNEISNDIKNQCGVRYSFVYIQPANNQDGGVEGGNIRSVILYREDAGLLVAKIPGFGLLQSNPNRIGSEQWPFSSTRKPLVVLFDRNGQQFLLIASHLTSRGADSPLFGSQQPIEKPEARKRIAQAQEINQFVMQFRRQYPGIPIIIAGDLNDDPWSETLDTLSGSQLIKLNENILKNERFSFILDGNAIQLDYILLANGTPWDYTFQIRHLNSTLDHSEQVSDHDPVVADFFFP